jgi:hypothetical protein
VPPPLPFPLDRPPRKLLNMCEKLLLLLNIVPIYCLNVIVLNRPDCHKSALFVPFYEVYGCTSLVTLEYRPPGAIEAFVPHAAYDCSLWDRVSGRERTLGHFVDENEPDDVGQGQTRMECLWNERPLERTILKGVANSWYANHLIWPKALDQRV